MSRFIIGAATLLLSSLALSATPASAQAVRNYDCSKAGNANKAACKGKVPAPAPKPAAVATPAARNYDCSKAGNANKAACKGKVVAVPAPKATPIPATRNYDCSKAGNANKAACKGTTPVAKPAPAPVQAPAATHVAPATHRAATGQNTNPGGPGGATAKCKDNTMSFSAHRSGTCAKHGGVAQWY
ncbi:hypothetical protein GCM10009087_04970 [Sphingomonas oligophenolica]|uniref:DUF3761 domain-containing protein n=1 Tax=Sphingomonas oligophenolica TaxID=301154 RepID=A0ABU9YCA6_9SPHN